MTDDQTRDLAERLFIQAMNNETRDELPHLVQSIARKCIAQANLFAHKWHDPEHQKWGVEEYVAWQAQRGKT